MRFKFEIIQGLETRPIKVGIYGAEGIGKTSLANEMPNALIVDTENGSSRINCRRIKCSSWEDLLAIAKGVIDDTSICRTLVIDTLDKAETYCIDYLCQKFRKANIEDWGYGKGYTVLQDEVSKLFELLNKVIGGGVHVAVIAHGKPRKYEPPEESGAFDRWELKLTRQVAPLFKEWCDILLFCNYKTYVVTSENNTKKAQGGKRVMYTTHHACWDAKNRFNLPDELELSFKHIAHLFINDDKTQVSLEPSVKPSESDVISKLKELINDSDVTVEEVEQIVIDRGKYQLGSKITDYSDDFITRWIIPNWKRIFEFINKNKTNKGDN